MKKQTYSNARQKDWRAPWVCRGTRGTKFTWVGSKYRPRNKNKTMSMGLTSRLPKSRFQPAPASPAHHKRDECVKRSDARHFIFFVLVSPLVYNDNGSGLFSRWKSGDQGVARARRAAGTSIRAAASSTLFSYFSLIICFIFLLYFSNGSLLVDVIEALEQTYRPNKSETRCTHKYIEQNINSHSAISAEVPRLHLCVVCVCVFAQLWLFWNSLRMLTCSLY